MICNNCAAKATQKYCPQCGQKTSTYRLDVKGLFHDGWHAVTHTDKGLFRLIADLTVHPRTFYENYFSGQRKKYFSPVLFFILSAGLVALIYGYIFLYEDRVFHTNNEFGKIVFHETKFRALLILPVQILLTWIIFKKRFNLAEISVFWLFSLGLTYCLRIICAPVYFPLIAYKDTIDYMLFYLTYLVLLYQAIQLFGFNFRNILAILLIINVSIILDSLATLYILFGTDIFDNPFRINGWWELIKGSY